jgi:hypothetical protein
MTAVLLCIRRERVVTGFRLAIRHIGAEEPLHRRCVIR